VSRHLELHRWEVSPEEVIEIQNRLRSQLDSQSEPERIETVAGIDVSYDKGSDWLFAAIVVLQIHDLQILDSASVIATVPFFVPRMESSLFLYPKGTRSARKRLSRSYWPAVPRTGCPNLPVRHTCW
jgi:hypothetical protein